MLIYNDQTTFMLSDLLPGNTFVYYNYLSKKEMYYLLTNKTTDETILAVNILTGDLDEFSKCFRVYKKDLVVINRDLYNKSCMNNFNIGDLK